MGWVVNANVRPLYPVPIVKETEWAPGPVRTGVEDIAHTEIRSPDRASRSELLY
jgi:hypothetical protein